MKKLFIIAIISCVGSKAFSQTTETFIEEKSSAWIRVSLPERPVARTESRPARNSASRRSVAPKPQPAPEPKPTETFEKTNQQVQRFKKQKKG